jgi:hypothetical protein
MAMDPSQNDGLFIDGKSWECVYRKISSPSLFQSVDGWHQYQWEASLLF